MDMLQTTIMESFILTKVDGISISMSLLFSHVVCLEFSMQGFCKIIFIIFVCLLFLHILIAFNYFVDQRLTLKTLKRK